MDVLTTKEVADRLGCSPVAVKRRCQNGQIEGAEKKGHDWLIPAKALEGLVIKSRQRKPKDAGRSECSQSPK